MIFNRISRELNEPFKFSFSQLGDIQELFSLYFQYYINVTFYDK